MGGLYNPNSAKRTNPGMKKIIDTFDDIRRGTSRSDKTVTPDAPYSLLSRPSPSAF
jgi:hypothetical protein